MRLIGCAAILLLLAASRAPLWVIDGDTIDVRGERVRIANLDAPDVGTHAKCALEEQRGQRAKAYAIRIIRSAHSVAVADRQGHDRYGRSLARVIVDGEDFAGLMIRKGVARPWGGRSSDWCSR